MAIIVEWSELAASSLEEIFGYYKKVAGLRIARKIAMKITQRTQILSDNPLAGQREELLQDLSVEFRYLVEGNYKILYYTLPEKVVISLVFDCRQNSEKMRDIK